LIVKETYSFKETKGIIISDNKKAIKIGKATLEKNRKILEKYINKDPLFLHSLEPINLEKGPNVIMRMIEVSRVAGVGPMAAVAGVLADLAVEKMIESGAKVAVIEDGGEASADSTVPIDVALQAGKNILSKKMGFRLEHFPIGIATSSGKYSHALSFGEADSVTIFAQNAGLADSVATSVGNVVKGKNKKRAIEIGIKKGLSIKGVHGIFIIYGEKVGKAGKIPRLINISSL
jgi:ApbE superfamily uncharacterized protein (UPF0280 family)